MRRLLILILTLVLVAQSFSVCAANELELIINGTKMDSSLLRSESISYDNHKILASASPFADALGATLTNNAGKLVLSQNGVTIEFTIGSNSVVVNGTPKQAEVSACTYNSVDYIPVEICGREFGYHVLRERAGNRVRIISKTSTTAPAVSTDIKPGMAELVSTVHRPVPTLFSKSNELDDLIYNKTDYQGVVHVPDDYVRGDLPTGPVIFSYDDFLKEIDSATSSSWHKLWLKKSLVGVSPELISMSVNMAGTEIGLGTNNCEEYPFNQALRLKVSVEQTSVNQKAISFEKKLPETTYKDKYLLTYYARLIDGGDPDYGTGSVAVQIQGDNLEKSTSEQVFFGKEWTRFDFLCTGVNNAVTIRFIPAFYVQTYDIAGFEIRNLGPDADVSYFDEFKTELLPSELSPDAQWRKDALDRIEEVRKGDFSVVVKDAQGKPVSGAEVELDMFEHEFKFGVTMDKEYLEEYASTGRYGNQQENFIKNIGSLFNAMSVGNHLKWRNYVRDKTGARKIIDAAKEQGIKYVRGHALWMPANSYTEDPQEMYDLLTDSRDKNVRYAELLTFIKNHFSEMNEKFPEIYEWDVTNETHGRTFFTGTFGEKIFNDIYRIAAEELTNGQALVLCDNRQFEDQYWERLDWFKEQGIEYDRLGMQGHSRIGSADIENNYRPSKMLEVWDRFAYEYGKTFEISEFSLGAFHDEYGYEGQGDYFRDVLIAAYSHPACTGFNLWWLADYWLDWNVFHPLYREDSRHTGAGVSPILTRTFDKKPGYAQFTDLLYNKWWTKDAKATTDNTGCATVNGFYGDYDVTVKVNGEIVKTDMVAFHKGYENVLTIIID